MKSFSLLFSVLLGVLAPALASAAPGPGPELLLEPLGQVADYLAARVGSGNPARGVRDAPLVRLGLDAVDSASIVTNAYRSVQAAVANDWRQPTGEGKVVDDRTLDMPFSDVFALKPVNIRYIAGLLGVLARVYPGQANEFAPLFGVRDKSLVDTETVVSTAGLMAAISTMDAESLAILATASSSNSHRSASPGALDSLITNGSLFALSDILTMEPKRVREVARLFSNMARLPPAELQKYLQDVGWEGHGIAKLASDGSTVLPIPNLSFVFPVADATLQGMAAAARSYAGGASSETRAVRPEVQQYLKEARDFFDKIPKSALLATLSPNIDSVAALVQILAMSYMYPDDSYWELVWRYYRQLGMPGISWISEYPSQIAGDLASSLVGSHVSSVISSAFVSLIGGGGNGPTPTTSSSMADQTPSDSTDTSPSTDASPSTSTSTTNGGIWGGLFGGGGLFTAPAAGSTKAPVAPTLAPVVATPSHSLRGTVVLPPAMPRAPLSATLDLNQNMPTRVTLQLDSQPEALFLTVIPRTQ